MTLVSRFPYPGLRAFRREEVDLFFGRDTCIDDMVDKLAATRFLAVLGSSGSGKSSIVRTGLFSALRLGLNPGLGADWLIVETHPGTTPFQNLAEALVAGSGGDAAQVSHLARALKQGPRALEDWYEAGYLRQGRRLLLMVDQFEELFRFSDHAEREEPEAYARLLMETAQSESPIYIAVTMRSEYLGACSLISGLAERINSGLYLTPRLTRDECREAIEGPAKVCGFEIEPALVNRLLNDMAEFAPWSKEDDANSNQLERISRRADQLPLMQHVLNRLWQRASAQTGPTVLKLKAYEDLGALEGALDEHGAEIMGRLGSNLAGKVETVFRALVSGVGALAVRRPCSFGDLRELLGGDGVGLTQILDAFRASDCNFLQPPRSQDIDDHTLIDISHESLIRQWGLLKTWADKEDKAADRWNRLSERAVNFQHGRGSLMSGLDLSTHREWWDQALPTHAWARRYKNNYHTTQNFLEASEAAEIQILQEKSKQAEAEKRRQKQEAESRLKGRFMAVGLLLAVIVAGGSAFAFQYRGALITKLQKTTQELADEVSKSIRLAETANKERNAAVEARSSAQSTSEKFQQQSEILRKLNLELDRSKAESTDSFIALADAFFDNYDESDDLRFTACDQLQKQKNFMQHADRSVQSLCGFDIEKLADQRTGQTFDPSFSAIDKNSGLKFEQAEINVLTALSQRSYSTDKINDIKSYYKKTQQKLKKDWSQISGVRNRDPRRIAEFAKDAYYFIYFLNENGMSSEALAIFYQMENAVTARSDGSRISSNELSFALVRYYWVKSLLQEVGTLPGDSKASANQAFRIANSIFDGKYRDPDFLRLHFVIQSYNSEQNKDKSAKKVEIEKACKTAEILNQIYPNKILSKVVLARCDLLKYGSYQIFGSSDGLNFLDSAQARFSGDANLSMVKIDSSSTTLSGDNSKIEINRGYTTLASIYQKKSDYYSKQNNTLQQQRWARRAFRVFANMLKDDTLPYSDNEIVEYLSFKNIEAFNPGARNSENINARSANVLTTYYFANIARDAGAIATAFPGNRRMQLLAGEARNKVVDILLKNQSRDKLLADFNAAAVTNFSAAMDFPKALRQDDDTYGYDSDNFANACKAYAQAVEIQIQLKNAGQAIGAWNKAKAKCGTLSARFDWDFYLWQHIAKPQRLLGDYLFELKDYKRATPYLAHASEWGHKESTVKLADIYARGLNGVRDNAKAKALVSLSKKQSLKRFTVPTDFNGVKYPFHVYVMQWPAAYAKKYPGIRGQALWVKYARGGNVPQDVIDSFDKVQKIAFENDVSYPDLCVYTFGAATSEQKADKVAKGAE